MIVVQYILPTLRAEITKELIEKHGLRKTEAADKMGVTPAAVTQYLKRDRGNIASELVRRSKEVMDRVSDITNDLVRGESPADILLMKLCMACRVVRTEKLICELHMEEMPSLRGIDECSCSLGLVGWNKST